MFCLIDATKIFNFVINRLTFYRYRAKHYGIVWFIINVLMNNYKRAMKISNYHQLSPQCIARKRSQITRHNLIIVQKWILKTQNKPTFFGSKESSFIKNKIHFCCTLFLIYYSNINKHTHTYTHSY